MLKQKITIQNLCDVSILAFEQKKNWVNGPLLEKMALHVIKENVRVNDALVALQ